MKTVFGSLGFLAVALYCSMAFAADSSFTDAEIDSDIANIIYQGGEKLAYKISWSGGIKIGEMRIELRKVSNESDSYDLSVDVKDSGFFHFFYPVNDSFVTRIHGKDGLPTRYEVTQREGSGYTAHRITEYDQKTGQIRYRKNDETAVVYSVTGSVHNEFSSFFITRSLLLSPDRPQIVPTFVDGKRYGVVVRTGVEERIYDTVRGAMNVLPVMPIMKFKGLYDKSGDTVIWLSNDPCRIPVRINSKIAIGSLTAELVSYENPRCVNQASYHLRIPEGVPPLQELELGD